jgi:hypothetical protein
VTDFTPGRIIAGLQAGLRRGLKKLKEALDLARAALREAQALLS